MRGFLTALLVALWGLLWPFPSFASPCLMELAQGEMLGPPQPGQQVASIIPYDGGAGANFRVCWAPIAGRDQLAVDFQTAPANVTCSAGQAPVAATRLDFTMTPLTAATQYWYKIQCDAPTNVNPDSRWTDRAALSFRTAGTVGVDSDFTFTADGDTHFYALFRDTGDCGDGEVRGLEQVKLSWRDYQNVLEGISAVARERQAFHVNLGDYYMVDAGSSLNGTSTCPTSHYENPPDGTVAQGYNSMWDQLAGWPTRTPGTAVKFGIQTVAVDSTVRTAAEFHIWASQHRLQKIYSQAPMIFAWGNHDFPNSKNVIGNTTGGCDRWVSDGQGAPKSAPTHMGEAWRALNYNPNTALPNLELDCDGDVDPDPTVTCNNNGYYYTFTHGLVQVWVLNPWEESAGLGADTATPFDGTHRYMEVPDDWSLGKAQFQWLRETMEASNAKWKFIVTHNLPGGMEGRATSPNVNPCYFYGRGSMLTVSGRACSGAPFKPCEMDETLAGGFNEANDGRPAGWKALYGTCPAGQTCIPSSYANRVNQLLGNVLYGAPAINTLMQANIDSGGSNFYLQGHDHLTAGGCKYATFGGLPGCADVWHVTTGQLGGSYSAGGDAVPPVWATSGSFASFFDWNGDTLPDYRADGAPYTTPVDINAGNIHQSGSQIRGFLRVAVTNEGVKIAHIGTDRFDLPATLGQEIFSFNVPTQAVAEVDFDRDATCLNDSEARLGALNTFTLLNGGPTCVTGIVGTRAANMVNAAAVSLLSMGGLPTGPGDNIQYQDFLFRVNSVVAAGGGAIVLRSVAGAVNTTVMTFIPDAILTTQGQFSARSKDLTFTTCTSPSIVGTTYMVRDAYNPTLDDNTLLVGACDPGDDNCDGILDSDGVTKVAVPQWGTGAFCNVTNNGVTGGAAPTAIELRVNANVNYTIDEWGYCQLDLGVGFKCGDGFE